mgnify:CR=1 FL=1
MKIRCRLVAILLCCLLLFLAGCSKPIKLPEVPTTEATEETTKPTEPNWAEASLSSLRQAMVETPQVFAVAYFGYQNNWDSDIPVDPFEAMQAEAPQLCADLPFLLDIPRERIIGEYGELYCIVPLDENATVAVSKGVWDENSEQYLYEESLYFSESGEPILLFCNGEGWEPDTQLFISGPSGEMIWYPMLDDNDCPMSLWDDNGEKLFLDFSSYREILVKDHKELEDDEWVKPTKEFLIGTTWVWEGWTKDSREVSYQVSFDEDTLSVRWNDGFDEEDHEYPDARWELTHEDGYAVLSIDFREMAGVLRYNLMYHEVYDYMYFGMDVLQEEMPVGWEPLYRYMLPPITPEPVEMLGDWELAWTEVEGYREEIEPGSENISIFLNDSGGFRISLTDYQNSKKSFKNKELGIYEGELYSGCGNDLWMTYIGYMGPDDIIYSITLTWDDTLLMQMYWEIDGGVPMVAHKGYRRVAGSE